MEATRVHIQALIKADVTKVWTYYTQPDHITQWNFANDDWHCPEAKNDLRPGGKYFARMEAKDGSFGFDFTAVYDEISQHKKIGYTIEDGRKVITTFQLGKGGTLIETTFDAESQNSVEMQREGWQAILNNFKKYTESH